MAGAWVARKAIEVEQTMAESVDMIRRIYEAFDRGDIGSLLASLDPHIEWNEAEHVTFWPGRASEVPTPSSKASSSASRLPFGRTWKVHIDRLLACGDTVLMQGRYSGTAQATGSHLTPQVAHIWDLEGDNQLAPAGVGPGHCHSTLTRELYRDPPPFAAA